MLAYFGNSTDFAMPGENVAQCRKQRHSPDNPTYGNSVPPEHRNDQHKREAHNQSGAEIGHRSNERVPLLRGGCAPHVGGGSARPTGNEGYT